MRSISDVLSVERIVTIVGAGGSGKHRLQFPWLPPCARRLTVSFALSILGSLSNSLQVPSALASALGISVASNDPVPALVAFLRTRRMLIVLDSCEHVIDAAAELAHRILNGAPSVRILATSREALRVENERVYRLEPLEYPPSGVDLTTGDVLASRCLAFCRALRRHPVRLRDRPFRGAPRHRSMPQAGWIGACNRDGCGAGWSRGGSRNRGPTRQLVQLPAARFATAAPRNQTLRSTSIGASIFSTHGKGRCCATRHLRWHI